jgi:hypothetical protein
MLRTAGYLVVSVAALVMSVPAAYGDNSKKFGFEFEAGPVWQSRNDVRIPNDAGTKFSLRGIQGSGPFAAARLYFDYAFLPKHELRFLAAPLTLKGSGQLAGPTFFAGATFSPGQPVEGVYQFNSYRLTYRYRIYERDRWTWKVGLSGKIRDAKIELRQGGLSAVDDNVGFVPLLHLDGEYRWNQKWRLNLNMDGLAAPQGRAFDAALKLKYDISRNWTLGFGYRTLEGGADVKNVYAFGWRHYSAASISVRF